MFGCDFMGNAPIRVLHVIGVMNRGGAETMIMNIYRNIDRSKVQFDFVENTDKPAVFDNEILSLGGRIYRCPHYNGKNHFLYKKWWNEFFREHKNEYKIIHGHLGSTASIYLKIAKKFGILTIAHSHNTIIEKNLSSLLYKIYSYPTRYIADYFFTCSKVAGISRFGKRVMANCDKSFYLKNAIETRNFQFNTQIRKTVIDELNITGKKVIGHIGRFNIQKNHAFLIDIFKIIHDEDKNTVLLLLGDGEEKNKIIQKVCDLKIEDSVYFLGVRSDVNRILQAMDIMLFPSLYEGLPVTIIEAQAAGLPCLLSDRITKECKIMDFVEFLSLKDSLEDWAKKTFEMINIQRTDTREQVIAAHYDIKDNVQWLEQFYLSKSTNKD